MTSRSVQARQSAELAFPWKRFFARYHRQRPTVFENVLARPFATPAETFHALSTLATGESAESLFRVHDGGVRRVEPEPALLPRRSDRSVEGYIARLARRMKDPGIVVNALQSGSSALWERSFTILQPIYERMGVGGALLDLFAGTYKRSFLGVHKDEQDVFTFVLSGRKRFLVWPFETLARRFGVGDENRWLPHNLVDADVDALRREALVLEAGPRDVMYWPADWWHCAESDGELVVTAALGIFRKANPLHLLVKSLQAFAQTTSAKRIPYGVDTFPWRATPRAQRQARALRAASWAPLLASDELQRQEALVHATWLSAMGYARPPPRRERLVVRRDDRVRVHLPQALRLLERGDEMIVCAGGHSLSLPRHRRIAALFATLKLGRPWRVAGLARRFSGGARADEQQLSPELVIYLLKWLGESNVLVRLPNGERGLR